MALLVVYSDDVKPGQCQMMIVKEQAGFVKV